MEKEEILNRSKQACRYGHVWTWNDHNRIVATIEEIKLRYREIDNQTVHLQEIIKAYESLIEKLNICKNINSARTLLSNFYLPGQDKEVRKNIKVYLSGSADEYEYRKNVKIAYGKYLDLWDPIEKENIDDPDLVNKDKEAIKSSDILVAFIRKFTCGTLMEIQYTYNLEKKIPIYVITHDKFVQDIWLNHHTDRFFSTVKKCFDFIIRDYQVLPSEDIEEDNS